jgi:CRP/FNR family cyclic AMP-dependent transcriptional regulator
MPRTQTAVDHLQSLSLLAACSPSQVRLVGRHAELLVVAADAVLVREGAAGHEAFVVAEGRAAVTRDGRTVAELGPGDLFGELALLTRSPRDATVTAITPMVLVVFEERALRGLMIEVPALGRALIARLARRLQHADVGAAR